MEKDTDSKKITLELNGLLPYQEEMIALYKDFDCLEEVDSDTVAWARLGEESIELLAAAGEAQYVSIVPGALEYKLVDYDHDEPLDDPLRDLGSPVGATRYNSVLEGFARLGLVVYPSINKDEQAAIVKELDSFETDQLESGHMPEHIERLVSIAVEQGISRIEVEKVLDSSAGKLGILIGLSKEFLDEAGEDVWPENFRGENNYPCRYAKLKKGLRLDHITRIIPLDNTSKFILEGFKEHAEKYEDEQEAKKTIKETSKVFRLNAKTKGIELDA